MVIPLTGQILFSDIDKELKRDVAITETSLGTAANELISGKVPGAATLASSLRGYGNFAGTQLWTSPDQGLIEFTVPDYRTMLVQVAGAGGGGGAGSTTSAGPTAANGTNGGNTEFRTATPVVGLGGLGGLGGGLPGGRQNSVQPPSSGTGGDIYNIFAIIASGSGLGEPGTTDVSGTGGGGGRGGQASKIFTRGDPGAPVPGTIIPVFLGIPGVNGNPNLVGGTLDGFFYTRLHVGAYSYAKVSWTGRQIISPFFYDYPGIYQFLVPNYTSTLTVNIRGATGGGGAARSINGSTSPTNGTAGGNTTFAAATPLSISGSGGGQGGGFGTNGQVGSNGVVQSGFTGQGPNTIFGGLGATGTNGNGGAGGSQLASPWGRTYTRGVAGSPVPGTTIVVTVGAGGQNGDPDLSGVYDGQNGRVDIFWN